MRDYEELLGIADELENIGLAEDTLPLESTGLCTLLGIGELVRLYAAYWEFFSGCFT